MDPIQRKTANKIEAPQNADAGTSTGKTQKFNLPASTPTDTPQNIVRPTFDGMASQIRDGVSRSLTREQVRDELIDQQAKQTFGENATPAMTSAIGEAFKNDPHLSQLFNQLYSKAITQPK